MSTVKVLYRSHVLTTFLGPVLGAMMKQLLASRRSKACACLRHEDKARLTGTIVGVPSMIDGVAVGHCGAFWTCKSTAVCERCASFGKQGHCRILFSRPSLERGMEAASGKKRTPQHEGVTEGRGGNGRKPPPPHTMCHTPHWASAGRVASITLYFSNAGNASAAILWRFFASAMVLRKGSPASAGASAGTRWQICGSKMAGFPDLVLQRCCLG